MSIPFVLLALARCVGIIFPLTWEWGMYDFGVRHLVPRSPASDQVVVVEIGNHTLDDLQERWPLSRHTWAEFIRTLDSFEPAVIGLDLVFDQPSDPRCNLMLEDVRASLARIEPLDDESCQDVGDKFDRTMRLIDGYLPSLDPDMLLMRAISESGRVILGEILPTRAEASAITSVVRSIGVLRQVARGHGLLNTYRSWDGVLREYRYISDVDGSPRPSLALSVVLEAQPSDDLVKRIAAIDGGAPLLRFPDGVRHLQFSDILLHGEEDAERLHDLIQGRIVLVGETASGMQEQHPTPIHSVVAGVDIHAFAVMNLLNGTHASVRGAAAWCGFLVTLAFLAAMILATERFSLMFLGGVVLGSWLLHLAIMYVLLAYVGWVVGFLPVALGVLAIGVVELAARIRSLSQYRRIVAEKERLNEAKSDFIATISHELRTPLTSIRGSLGLIASGAVGELPAQIDELIHIAHTNTERLIRLVNNFLDFQKIATGKMEYHFEPVELEAIVASTVTAMEAFARQFEVGIVVEDMPRAFIEADIDLLTQALTNLLSNAIKFSPHGEEVVVRATISGKRVRIDVIDRGPGIPEEFRARIFTKFAQAADSTSSPRTKGSGLGLNIVKLIVEEHRGDVGFETELGKGSTFFMELPLASPPPASE